MNLFKNEQGSVLVFVTLMIVVLLIMVGMGLDSGQLTFVRSQGQRAVDAAALAGASAVPTGSDTEVYARVTAFNTQTGDNRNDYVGSATAANQLTQQHVTFVQYDKNTGSITAVGSAAMANGVRVALETTNPYGGPAGGAMNSPLFLTPLLNLLGSSTPANANVNVSAVAYVEPIPAMPIALGGCPIPNPQSGPPICTEDGTTDSCTATGSYLDINGKQYPVMKCMKCNALQVPSPKDNSCYTTFTYSSANAKSMKELINNYKTCGGIPPVYYGTPINLNNGQVNSVLQELAGVGPFSGPTVAATDDDCYLIPVVPQTTNCNQTDPILMFARMCIREVNTKGSPKYILADITCPVSPYTSRDTKCYVPRLVRDKASGM